MDINSLNVEIRSAIEEAKGITEAATKANRGLTAAEDKKVKGLLEKAGRLKTERDAADAALTKADEIRRSVGGGSGFKSLAAQVIANGRGEIRLKSVTETDADLLSTRIEGGIRRLPADERYLYPVLPSQDPGAALHVQDFRVTARGVTGTIERDPLATTDKAEADVTIEGFTADMKQLAVMVAGVPNALLASEAQLSSVLESEMNLKLRGALDAHVLSQIDAASVDHLSSVSYDPTINGFNAQGAIREGLSHMALSGFKPDVVAISPSAAEDIDLTKVTDEVSAFPFGLRVVVSPDIDTHFAGAPVLIDTSNAGVLYQGSLALQSDPYSGFAQNTVDLRAEFLALCVIRRPDAILVCDGGGS